MGDQKHIRDFIASSCLGIILVGTAPAISLAADDVTPPKQPKRWEKCYGIVKAGENNCSSLDGRHGCGGAATVDGDPTEYMWVPAGFCERIVGGTLANQIKTNARKRTCRSN